MHSLAHVAFAFALSALASAAPQTKVIDFDDLVGAGPITAGYGGVTSWGSWTYSDVADPLLPPASGSVRARSQGTQQRIEFGQEVIFSGARLVTTVPFAWRLYRAGQVVHTSQAFGPNPGGPSIGAFSAYSGYVDALEFVATTDEHSVDDFAFIVPPTTLGEVFCFPNKVNSTGAVGTLTASGSLSVAANDLTLHATELPRGSFGFAIVSRTQGFVSGPTGPGILCINGQIGRFIGPAQIKNSGTTGTFDLSIDLTAIPTPTGFIATVPGDTWNFQVWYRDMQAFGQATSHFTSGVELDFQ